MDINLMIQEAKSNMVSKIPRTLWCKVAIQFSSRMLTLIKEEYIYYLVRDKIDCKLLMENEKRVEIHNAEMAQQGLEKY